MVGRKVFIFVFYFEAEVLMPKYNKTYPYLLWFLHPSVQAYHININIVMERRKRKFSDGQFLTTKQFHPGNNEVFWNRLQVDWINNLFKAK